MVILLTGAGMGSRRMLLRRRAAGIVHEMYYREVSALR